MAACEDHLTKRNCAWRNTRHHIDYPKKEQFRACFRCQGIMNKGAYQSQQPNSDYTWNIHHKDSDPKNGKCENLVATHPDCNIELG